MRCPLCGGYSVVMNTRKKRKNKKETVTRYRKCHNCEFQFPTEETAKHESEYALRK